MMVEARRGAVFGAAAAVGFWTALVLFSNTIERVVATRKRR